MLRYHLSLSIVEGFHSHCNCRYDNEKQHLPLVVKECRVSEKVTNTCLRARSSKSDSFGEVGNFISPHYKYVKDKDEVNYTIY